MILQHKMWLFPLKASDNNQERTLVAEHKWYNWLQMTAAERSRATIATLLLLVLFFIVASIFYVDYILRFAIKVYRAKSFIAYEQSGYHWVRKLVNLVKNSATNWELIAGAHRSARQRVAGE